MLMPSTAQQMFVALLRGHNGNIGQFDTAKHIYISIFHIWVFPKIGVSPNPHIGFPLL